MTDTPTKPISISASRKKRIRAKGQRQGFERQSVPTPVQSARSGTIADAPGGIMPEGKYGSNIHVVHAAVDDPWQGEGQPKHIRVAVNRKTDHLVAEMSYQRISTAAYHAGLVVQAMLERLYAGGSGQSQWSQGDRVDANTAHELAILRGIDGANRAIVLKNEIMRCVGGHDLMLLTRTLGYRQTWPQIAVAMGTKGRERDTTAYLRRRFCEALEALAIGWAAKGKQS